MGYFGTGAVQARFISVVESWCGRTSLCTEHPGVYDHCRSGPSLDSQIPRFDWLERTIATEATQTVRGTGFTVCRYYRGHKERNA